MRFFVLGMLVLLLVSAASSAVTIKANTNDVIIGPYLSPAAQGTVLGGSNAVTTSDSGSSGGGYVGGPLNFACPVTASVGSKFGWRNDPFTGQPKWHSGIDLKAGLGTPIKASEGGRVELAGSYGGYGNAVIIDHSSGIKTLYGHMSEILTTSGALIAKGQVIGKVGSTGRSTGPHLHFEILQNGKAIDPIKACTGGYAMGGSSSTTSTSSSSIVSSKGDLQKACQSYQALFEKYIKTNGLDKRFGGAALGVVGAIAYTESGCNANPSNGQGMMQVVRCQNKCTLEQNINEGTKEIAANYDLMLSKGAKKSDAIKLIAFGYNRGMATATLAVQKMAGGKDLYNAMLDACYYYFDKGAYGGCGGFGRTACCSGPGLGARYPERVFQNMAANVRTSLG